MSGIEHTLSSHRWMLADRVRVAALERAIDTLVRPGDVAIDLGSGTGLLSLMAVRAGARRVYAIEAGDAMALAKEVIRANGADDKIVLLHDRSDAIELPERADVLIGYLAFDEGLLSSFIDARARLLKAEARLIPSRIQIVGALVNAQAAHTDLIEAWANEPYGFDFSSVERRACQQPCLVDLTVDDLHSEPQVLLDIDLTSSSTLFAKGSARFTVQSDGIVHGLGAWLKAEHRPGDWLSDVPPATVPSWHDFLFPVREAWKVKTGDVFDVTLSTYDGRIWRWQVTVYGEGGNAVASFDHSTFSGFPLTSHARARSPLAVRELSPFGRAAALAMTQMEDRSVPHESVERALADRFPTVVPSQDAGRRLIDGLRRALRPHLNVL